MTDNIKTPLDASMQCPVCTKMMPHNHSLFEVEAFHRANESAARNYGLVTFRVEEIRSLTARRANGINDRRARNGWQP